MKIFLAADHGGFEYKKQLLSYLQTEGHEVVDVGDTVLDEGDDYPDFVNKLAKEMLVNPDSMGILLCRNGVGMSIAANRYSHLRAALGFNSEQVLKARTDDNANVLSVPADYMDFENIKSMTNTFLNTPFSNADRHVRRLAKVDSLPQSLA